MFSMQRALPHSRSIISASRRPCGQTIWTLDTGDTGTPGAAWCGERARLGRRPPTQVGLREAESVLGRLRKRPEWLLVGPQEDAFARGSDVHRRAEVLSMIRLVLTKEIGVALVTRGGAMEGAGLVEIARRFGERLAVTVGVFDHDPAILRRWEPGLSAVGDRLDLARQLQEAGAHVTVELGPLVPFVNDEERRLKGLLRRLARTGLKRVSVRWIQDAPGLCDQVGREVARASGRLLDGWFGQPGGKIGPGRRAITADTRRPRMATIRRVADVMSIEVAGCACEDHLHATSCVTGPPVTIKKQLDLFDEVG